MSMEEKEEIKEALMKIVLRSNRQATPKDIIDAAWLLLEKF